LAACGAHFLCDHLGWLGLEAAAFGREGAAAYLRRIMPYAVMIELLPLPGSALIAAAYTSSSEPLYGLMILSILTIGLVLRRLIISLNEERRHSQELAAVDALSRALLGARLDPGEIGALIYHYCNQVVEAPTFCSPPATPAPARSAAASGVGQKGWNAYERRIPGGKRLDVACRLEGALPTPPRPTTAARRMRWLEALRCAGRERFPRRAAPLCAAAVGEPARSAL
jgi:hypothetical protein